MVGRMPVCFLHVRVDPKTVDVNVHPTKVEVRFEDSGAIYTRLLHSLRHKFLNSDLVAKVRVPTSMPSLADGLPVTTAHHVSNDGGGSDLLNWARGNTAVAIPDFRPFQGANSPGLATANRPMARMDDPFYSPESPHLELAALAPQRQFPSNEEMTLPSAWQSRSTDSTDALEDKEVTNSIEDVDGSHKQTGFQIHDRYIVTQDESGMVIVDQHALHERILYEQIKNKVMSKSLERQRLLLPESVTLTPNEAAAAIDNRETLAEIGIEVEPFGGDTILVTSFPAMLAKMQPAEMLRQVLEPLMTGGKKPDARNLLDELMNMIACKAAVKAGDRLSPDEITALLEQRHCYQDTHHCPHGRPTALFFSREQLDKMFKRT